MSCAARPREARQGPAYLELDNSISKSITALWASFGENARSARLSGDQEGMAYWGWLLREENDIEGARPMFEAAMRISRPKRERSGLAYAILGLACLAGDLGDWRQAAERHGAAQAFLGRLGGPWQDPEGRYRQESIDLARARLGTERFDAAYAEGTALSFDDAIALALSRVIQTAA